MQCCRQSDPGRDSTPERKEIETDEKTNHLLKDHGHGDLTAEKSLSKGKAGRENSR